MKVSRLAVAALLASTATTPALAVLTKTTYTGVILDGRDETGLFGTPGSLNGKTVYLSYFFNDEHPGSSLTTTATYENLSGGGAGTPGYATIRINDVTLRLDGTSAFAEQLSDSAYDEIRHSVGRSDYDPDTGNYFTIEALASIYSPDERFIPHPVSVSSPLDFTPTPNDDPSAYSAYFETNRSDDGGLTNVFANATFIPARVTVGVVPEPATWGMMILGFGMAGVFLRRRRATRTVPALA